MAAFEGHTPYMSNEPATQPFAGRHGAQAAPGNGALPPGHDAFRVNRAKGSTTTKAFIKKIGD